MLLPKQQFAHWIVIRSNTHLEIAATQRLPDNNDRSTIVYLPLIDDFKTVHNTDIFFTIGNVKLKPL